MHRAASWRLRPIILLLGDSITEYGYGNADSSDIGWVSLLSAAFTRRCDVLNRGFAGYNTRLMLQLLPRIIGAPTTTDSSTTCNHDLLFCTIFLGANDAVLPGELQHVPIDEYAANLDKIMIKMRESTGKSDNDSLVPIILLSPPPIDEAAWAAWRQIEKSDRSNDVAREYGFKVKEVAAKHEQSSVVDTWELLEGRSDARSLYLSDGLHLNEKGNRKVYQGLLDVIKKDYPQLAPMSDQDGEGRYGTTGIPKEEKLWRELC